MTKRGQYNHTDIFEDSNHFVGFCKNTLQSIFVFIEDTTIKIQIPVLG